MLRPLVTLSLIAAAPATSAGEAVSVPSGQPVTFLETVLDAPGSHRAVRFRFLAPRIARGLDPSVASADMDYLCRTFALPMVAKLGAEPAEIVISLAERPLAYGEIAPDTTQFFEIYAPRGDECVWQGF